MAVLKGGKSKYIHFNSLPLSQKVMFFGSEFVNDALVEWLPPYVFLIKKITSHVYAAKYTPLNFKTYIVFPWLF